MNYSIENALKYFKAKNNVTTDPNGINKMFTLEDHRLYLDSKTYLNQTEIVIIDVRDKDSYHKGHIPTAINITRDQFGDLSKHYPNLDKSKTYVIYCYSYWCHLGSKAAQSFLEQGYKVMSLDGEFEGWSKAGFQIEVSSSQ